MSENGGSCWQHKDSSKSNKYLDRKNTKNITQPGAVFRWLDIIRKHLGWRIPPSKDTEKAQPGIAPKTTKSPSNNPKIVVIRNTGEKETKSSAPNLTLNVNNRIDKEELYIIAVLGIILQTGVLIFSAFITYHPVLRFSWLKDGKIIADYAFPCDAAGTLLLVAGMLLCSHVVESSTLENRYRPKGREARVIWLQKSGTVSDQTFDSFAVFPKETLKTLTTSRRNESKNTKTTAVIGTALSLGGFVAQFIGLRGMHWSASIAQLIAAAIMIVLRAVVRRNLSKLPGSRRLKPGYEMDWLALNFRKHSTMAEWLHRPEGLADDKLDTYWDWRPVPVQDPTQDKRSTLQDNPGSDPWFNAHATMTLRKDLGISAGWQGPASAEAIALANAIEVTMDTLFGSTMDSFTWSLEILPLAEGAGRQLVTFRVDRQGGMWKAHADEMEAVLSLWLYSVSDAENERKGTKKERMKSFQNENKTRESPGKHRGGTPEDNDHFQAIRTRAKHSLRFLGQHTAALERDLQWWLPNDATRLIQVKAPDPEIESNNSEVAAHRIVGFAPNVTSNPSRDARFCKYTRTVATTSPYENGPLAIESHGPLNALYAQYIFSIFMLAAAEKMNGPIGGKTSIRHTNTKTEWADDNFRGQPLSLHNTVLSSMVQNLENVGLGTTEEIYLSIIPPLSAKNRLPSADSIVEWMRKHTIQYEQLGHWMRAGSAYRWLLQTTQSFTETAESLTENRDFVIQATVQMTIFSYAVASASRQRREQTFEKTAIMDLEMLQSKLNQGLQTLKAVEYEDIFKTIKRLYDISNPLEDISWPSRRNYEQLKLGHMHRLALENKSVEIEEKRKSNNPGENDKDALGWTPLHYAAANNSTYALMQLLRYPSIDVNAQDFRGRTPLHHVCRRDEPSMIEYLVRRGARSDIQDIDGISPLHVAAIHDCSNVVSLLLESGTGAKFVDGLGLTPLHWSAYRGHVDTAQVLKDSVNQKMPDYNGRTPYLAAAIGGLKNAPIQGHISIMELLAKEGADKDARDENGRTALHLAVQEGDFHMVGSLKRLEVDMNAKITTNEWTPLHLAVQKRDKEMIELLTEQEVDIKQQAGTRRKVEINARDSMGGTPLHLAVFIGYSDIVELLQNKGARIRADDSMTWTLIHVAIANGDCDMIELLAKLGTDINAKDRMGWTILHYAVGSGNSDITRLLKESLDADVEIANSMFGGLTPLHLAVLNEKSDMVWLLVGLGANITTKDSMGWTPLRFANESNVDMGFKMEEDLTTNFDQTKPGMARYGLSLKEASCTKSLAHNRSQHHDEQESHRNSGGGVGKDGQEAGKHIPNPRKTIPPLAEDSENEFEAVSLEELEAMINEEDEAPSLQKMEQLQSEEKLLAEERVPGVERAKKEIEEAMEETDRLVREAIEAEVRAGMARKKAEAEAIARGERAAMDRIEAERKAEETRKKAEARVVAIAEKAVQLRLNDAIRAKEEAEAAAAQKAQAEAEWRKMLEEEAKIIAEIKARKRIAAEKKAAEDCGRAHKMEQEGLQMATGVIIEAEHNQGNEREDGL